MARAVNIPIPLKGMNTMDPFTQDNGFARQISDFQIYQGALSARPAHKIELDNGVYFSQINWFDIVAGVYYGIGNNGDIVNITTGAVIGTIAGACQANATTCKHVSIELLFGCQAPRSPTGAAFTAWTFTTAAITATAITCGCSWKGRLYVSDGTSIEYSNLGAIGASALNGGVPISYNMAGQSVIRMLTLTGSSQANILTDSLFAIFGSGGRVLMYSGTDPTDWVQIGQWDMPAPISNLGFVEIDGDIFISTTKYAYWGRDLLIGGAVYAYQNSPSKPIENLWQSLGYDSAVSNISVSHSYYLDSVAGIPIDAIVVQCSDQDTPAIDLNEIQAAIFCNLVYFRQYKAWALWFLDKMYAPVREISDTFYSCGIGSLVTSLAYTGGEEEDRFPTWKTPYLNPFAGKGQMLAGVRVFYKNETAEHGLTVGAVADFSDFTLPLGLQPTPEGTAFGTPANSSQQTVTLPANAYDQYRPFCAIGLQGAGISTYVQIRDEIKDDGALNKQIYQMIAYFEDGGDLY